MCERLKVEEVGCLVVVVVLCLLVLTSTIGIVCGLTVGGWSKCLGEWA